jgi:VIT1/CCC1 family predicted Fe2+/Mn2+ transporter
VNPEAVAAALDVLASRVRRISPPLASMMRFELGLEKPDPKRAPISAGTIAASYFIGGLIPLTPYILMSSISEAFTYSVWFTAIALVYLWWNKGPFHRYQQGKVGWANSACWRTGRSCRLCVGACL